MFLFQYYGHELRKVVLLVCTHRWRNSKDAEAVMRLALHLQLRSSMAVPRVAVVAAGVVAPDRGAVGVIGHAVVGRVTQAIVLIVQGRAVHCSGGEAGVLFLSCG